MKVLTPVRQAGPLRVPRARRGIPSRTFLAGFQSHAPRFRGTQRNLLAWLADAYVVHGLMDRERINALLDRYGGAADAIAYRGHELPDFSHRDWLTMMLFGPAGSDVRQKMQFFDAAVGNALTHFYPPDAAAPSAIVHVTCTGYGAPSAVQKLVAARQWGKQTEVLHAYHMGCYAAHPALRIAAGPLALASSQKMSVDVVHSELCSLHLDLTRHDPGQLVIQSLFADGYMRYSVRKTPPTRGAFFEILGLRDEILSNSAQAMEWTVGPFNFAMTLSKDVPLLLAGALPDVVKRLFQRAGLDYAAEKSNAVFAMHPGGPLILEWSQRALNLESRQLLWSRRILRDHGNMSSATLPHIWDAILKDANVSEGTLVVSLGVGPGLTISGALLRKYDTRAGVGLCRALA